MKIILGKDLLSESMSADDSPAKRYVRACAGGVLIGNVKTRMALLDTASQQVPVSITDGIEPERNCYVVSMRTAYSGYALEELKRLHRPLLTWPLKVLAKGADRLFQAAKIDKLVLINNWLLSTNLYSPGWDNTDLGALTDMLRREFPDHGIGFRSLNDFSNQGLRERLGGLGFLSIPSRQIYLFDGQAGPQSPFTRHHSTRIDASLLRRSPYTVVTGAELNAAEFERIEHLYNLLYLKKYSSLNPQYSAHWMECGQRDGWLELRALRNVQGRIDGVVGWFTNSVIVSAPVVGYDTSLPQKIGLYRQLTQLSLQEAAKRQQVLNFSAGAADFKRVRGGQPRIEYSLIYVDHLPWGRRFVWKLLSMLLHRIGVPLMRKLKL
ncbi:hypothetical protein QN386_19145 [Pseudomonas sp. CCI3.2]|nr:MULTISPECIES: hypothetical protein [unclassified Pseudomonas]MEB0079633.1 hypothetical protein [Pseudomonas sp. MH10out]MEB0103423.1 hypothetical protein [Pseudomonas sp. CCI3.2]MEB0157814.1 hypothetical protein [Pseudomonas sp. AH2 (2023)]MEB0169339.1 hypothetical protein [Pseudomonas sp. CCC4.4]